MIHIILKLTVTAQSSFEWARNEDIGQCTVNEEGANKLHVKLGGIEWKDARIKSAKNRLKFNRWKVPFGHPPFESDQAKESSERGVIDGRNLLLRLAVRYEGLVQAIRSGKKCNYS